MSVKIELTLSPQKSGLDGIVCIDMINEDLLDKLMNSTLIEDSEEWNETNILNKMKGSIKNKLMKVVYKKTKGMTFGRVSPVGNLSLSLTRRQLRHTLCKWLNPTTKKYEEYYYDIDIQNCHYVLLNQICNSNNLDNDKINEYVQKRDKIVIKIIKEWNIDRSKVKNLFIRMIYGGSVNSFIKENKLEVDKTTKLYKYLDDLQMQISKARNEIISKNKDLCLEVEKNKILKEQDDYNYESSCLSYYLQEYECRILENMYLYCKANKIIQNNICGLCSDGIMIPRDNIKDLNELMHNLEQNIKENVGFDVKLVHKEMDEDLIEQLDKCQLKKEIDPNSYKYKKEQFEKKNFKIMNPIMFATIKDDGELILKNKTDFINTYQNMLYIKKVHNKFGIHETEDSFILKWLSDPEMRTYEYLDFLPVQEVPNNVYNTFKGYEAEKLNTDITLDIKNSLIYKHLFNLCGNDDAVFNYVLMVLSRKVKNPSKLTNTALIFKSNQGAGKDTFFNWFGNDILGSDYYFNDTNTELLFGHFNPDMANKILCVINEISYKETIELVEKIKGAITTTTNIINQKGMKVYKNKNHITYIFFTNNDNPIKIDVNDRRYLAIKCNDDICNNNEYFTKLRNEMKSKKYNKCFYDYLMSLDSDDYDFTNNRPETEFNKDLKENNIPILAKFLEDLIYKKDDKETETFYASTLYDLYSDYLTANRIKMEVSSTQFGIQLKKYTSIEKKRTKKGNMYDIDYKKLEDELIKFKYMEPIPDEKPKKKD
jgi:hypothetical protein